MRKKRRDNGLNSLDPGSPELTGLRMTFDLPLENNDDHVDKRVHLIPLSTSSSGALRRFRTNLNSLLSNLLFASSAHYCAKYYLRFGIQGHFS